MKTDDQLEAFLAEKLTLLREDLSFNKSLAFCTRKHFQTLNALAQDGFTLKKIAEVISETRPISYAAFKNAMSKARAEEQQNDVKRDAPTVAQTISQQESSLQETQPTSSKNEVNDSENISEDLKQRWIKAFGFTLSDTFLPLAIAELTQYGWTPDNYYKLNEKHNLFNAKSLRRILSSISSHKATNKEYNS